MNKTLDFHFYALISAQNWTPNFGELGGPYSNNNNSLDFYRKNTKLVFKFKIRMSTIKNVPAALKNSLRFKSYCRNDNRRSLFDAFPNRLGLVNNYPLTYFLSETSLWDDWSRDIGKIFRGQFPEQNVRLPFLRPYIGTKLDSEFRGTRWPIFKRQ